MSAAERIGIPNTSAAHLANASMLSSSPDWARQDAPNNITDNTNDSSHLSHYTSSPALSGSGSANEHLGLNEDDSPNYFHALRTMDDHIRAQALDHIVSSLMMPENINLLRTHLPTVIRLAFEAPFEDIRERFCKVLSDVAADDRLAPTVVPVPPCRSPASAFQTADEQNAIDATSSTISPVTLQLFQETFVRTGRVTHIARLTGWHPEYYERSFASLQRVMREPGPLRFHERNYIVILAASRHQCQYMVSIQEQLFLMNGGDPAWLKGTAFVPRKMANLCQLTALLAHQPWLLDKDHIETLLKGQDAWSIGELVHAIVLIATALAQTGFVYGMGVLPELDLQGGISGSLCACKDKDAENEARTSDTNKVTELLKKLGRQSHDEDGDDTEDAHDPGGGGGGGEGEAHNDKDTDFVNAGSEGSLSSSTTPAPTTPSTPTLSSRHSMSRSTSSSSLSELQTANLASLHASSADLSRYTGGIDLTHTDFDVKSRSYEIFRVQQYGWKEHGYELVRMFYPDLADLLDEEFDFIYTMTDYTFHTTQDVDTLPFRRAIWYYVQRVKGMCHDDYDYQEVNLFLNRSIKLYVKKVTCFPEQTVYDDYLNLGYELRPDEKCHIALLATESLKQALLLYGLHTVMLYRNNRYS
eukprot:TRINITY_DN13403_c0_g1_i1.p1 TRINITY_DN13403_c0_g1~~TRINITY_DN13403_c0_g1_i1.p1  ORF type:complete len:643 (-),score=168.17 TRINITY_DN13403_c0_g1_i1:22-1950(-)